MALSPPLVWSYAFWTFAANPQEVTAPTDRSPPHELVPAGATGSFVLARVFGTVGVLTAGWIVPVVMVRAAAAVCEKTPVAARAPTAIPARATTPSRISASGFPERVCCG